MGSSISTPDSAPAPAPVPVSHLALAATRTQSARYLSQLYHTITGAFNCRPANAPEAALTPAPAPLRNHPQQWNIGETPSTLMSSNPQISSSWVYVTFIERNAHEIFFAYNVNTQMSLRFPDLPERLLNSATTVLNRRLYVIGGSDYSGNPSKNVYMCDPVAFTWVQLPSTVTPRQNAVATAANGRVFVFGGCRNITKAVVPWAEVYDPPSSRWRAIRNPPRNLSLGLSRQLLHAVEFKRRIFIRNDCRGVAYNVALARWEGIPALTSNCWFKWSSAVVVDGMFVAYHQEPHGEVSLGAYDPEQFLWLPVLQNLKPAFHIHGEMVNFLSVNGNLVAYHTANWRRPLKFKVMQMQMNSSRTRISIENVNSVAYPRNSPDWNLEGPVHGANP